eukprot:278398-Rhodomonas_salina.4
MSATPKPHTVRTQHERHALYVSRSSYARLRRGWLGRWDQGGRPQPGNQRSNMRTCMSECCRALVDTQTTLRPLGQPCAPLCRHARQHTPCDATAYKARVPIQKPRVRLRKHPFSNPSSPTQRVQLPKPQTACYANRIERNLNTAPADRACPECIIRRLATTPAGLESASSYPKKPNACQPSSRSQHP